MIKAVVNQVAAPSPIEAEGAEGARAVKTETVVEKSYGRADEGELETIAFVSARSETSPGRRRLTSRTWEVSFKTVCV